MRFLELIRVFTLPLSPLYWILVKLRNFLFEIGIFPQRSVNAKIISVGNITVGGAGKTPMSIYMIKKMKELNKSVAVLSRGYGRDSEGYLLVSDGKEILSKVNESGDEMYLTAIECECPAAVCEGRLEGARKLIDTFHPEVIVLDDAFQHRWIKRDLDIVIFDQRFINHANWLNRLALPTGSMRESFAALKRADCVIVNRKFSQKSENSEFEKCLSQKQLVFNSHYEMVDFIDVRNGKKYSSQVFQGQKSLAICGIASPHSFFEALDSLTISYENKLIFADHKKYSESEVQKIRKEFYDRNCYSVITTQKDAVKLMQFKEDLDDIDIYYLKIDLVIDEEEKFNNYLNEKLF